MKRLFTLCAVVVLAAGIYAQDTVTFRANMSVAIFKGNFRKATDTLVVRGDFQADAGDAGGNWQGKKFLLTDPDGDSIYTGKAAFAGTIARGKTYNFKFVKSPDGWENDPNRTFSIASTGGNKVLPVYYFNNDSSRATVQVVTNTLNFTADLTSIFGTGTGYFDPNTDSIQVMGLDWDAGDTVVSGRRRLLNSGLNPTIFKTTMVVKGVLNDSVKWKFKAYPDARFTNTGWETGQDRWLWYQANGTTVNLPTIVPSIYPSIGPLANNVNVLFQTNMNFNPRNRYNNQVIPLAQIAWMGVKGGSVPIGNWQGNWVSADTTAGYIKVLNDAGINGDRIAGDKIYSRLVTFPAATPGGAIEFKYCVSYPGADTANGGSSPLDNEGGFGQNHLFTLRDGSQINLLQKFGDFTTADVKENSTLAPDQFQLLQNYPNPFNPTTNISYVVPADGFVTLKIYNALGEEVAALINNFQKAGGYDVSFDASRLNSGVYFYSLTAGSFTATKKMMLVK